MALTLEQINKVTLRVCFLPWAKQYAKDMGMPFSEDWNPSDEELERFAERLSEVMRPMRCLTCGKEV